MSTCPHCGKEHTFDRESIVSRCAAVAAVEFNAAGKVTRIEFMPCTTPTPTTAPVVHNVKPAKRVIVETKTGPDGKRVVTKSRSA